MVVGGSCWWDVAENLPGQALWRIVQRQNLALCRRTVPTLARLLGVPVVHANWCGDIDARWALGTRYVSRYVQEACIVDATGRVLARRGADEGPGVIAADVEIGEPAPSGGIPSSFWLHPENRQPHWRLMWWLQNQHGRRYRRRTGAAGVPASGGTPEVGPIAQRRRPRNRSDRRRPRRRLVACVVRWTPEAAPTAGGLRHRAVARATDRPSAGSRCGRRWRRRACCRGRSGSPSRSRPPGRCRPEPRSSSSRRRCRSSGNGT